VVAPYLCRPVEDVNCLQGASDQNKDSGLPDTTSRETEKKQPSVGQRWLTALIAIPIVLVFAGIGGWAAFIAVGFVVTMTMLELLRMLSHAGYRPLVWMSFALSLLFLVAAMFPQQRLVILEVGWSCALLISLPSFFLRKNLDGVVADWALTLTIPLYLAWSMSFFLLLRGYEPTVIHFAGPVWVTLPRGCWWLLTTFLGVWGFDSAAFFTGRYLGRHKLAPHISPGKTWEGVAGGLVVSILAALLFAAIPLGVPWYLAVLLGVLIGIAAVFGDLAESLIKRQTHFKDSGQFMPGHGGLLDRIDSLLFAVVVVYLVALFIGL
jgi:phosphatidate cytidylyltransferase